jgi:hypothetical protein
VTEPELTILDLVPNYEQDLASSGENREAVDPDPREWWEIHELTESEAEAMK